MPRPSKTTGELIPVAGLSKSRILSARQCAKRAWLEVHRPELAAYDAAAMAVFRNGHKVGELAVALYGRGGGDVIRVEDRRFGPATTPERRAEIDRQLRAYCARDTEAMVRLVHFLGNE